MADLELTLRDIARSAASAIAVGGAALLALALCAELVRRRHAESGLVRVADRLVPSTMHRVAVGILTLLATGASVATPSVASADNSLRGWLESPSVPTTAVTPAPGSASARVPQFHPAGPTNHAGEVPSARAVPQPSSGPSVSAGSNHRSAPAPTAPHTVPAPITAPNPSPAPVLHPRALAAPPTSSPSPARKPPITAVAPTAAASQSPTLTTPTAADPARSVDGSIRHVVIAGDCLWDIAARMIGPGASNAAIDRGWRAIYAANRAAVGDDPGLIHPGIVLTIPTLDPTP